MLVAPAQATNRLGKECERDKRGLQRELRCCKKRAESEKQEKNCKQYVRNH